MFKNKGLEVILCVHIQEIVNSFSSNAKLGMRVYHFFQSCFFKCGRLIWLCTFYVDFAQIKKKILIECIELLLNRIHEYQMHFFSCRQNNFGLQIKQY